MVGMKRQWKLGDVAIVRNKHGVDNVAILSLSAEVGGWVWKYGVADTWELFHDDQIARPLQVINPSDRDQVQRLLEAYWLERDKNTKHAPALRRFVDVDECVADLQTALARLEDPVVLEPTGLGAVVVDDQGRAHVRGPRDDERPWMGTDGKHRAYREIIVADVVDQGVVR